MHTPQPSLFARHDTLFGICEALSQDFGFHPNYLRVAFAVSLLVSPVLVSAIYLMLGAIIMLSRWLFPSRQPALLQKEHRSDAPASTREKDRETIDFAEAA